MKIDEVWKPIPNYPDYLVSDAGNVRSLKLGQDRLMRLPYDSGGYAQFGPCINGKQTLFKVHRLVLLAFVGPVPDGMETRHLNGVRSDNRLENLKYGTAKENMGDKVQHGTDRNANKTHCPSGHPYDLLNTYRQEYPGGRFRRKCRTCGKSECKTRRLKKQLKEKVNGKD